MRRTLLSALFASLALVAQTKYKQPPEAILKVLRAPATPISSVSPAKTHLLLLEPDRYPPIAELAQPMLRLAGLRINPRNNGPRSPQGSFKGLELIDLATLKKQALPLPVSIGLTAPARAMSSSSRETSGQSSRAGASSALCMRSCAARSRPAASVAAKWAAAPRRDAAGVHRA